MLLQRWKWNRNRFPTPYKSKKGIPGAIHKTRFNGNQSLLDEFAKNLFSSETKVKSMFLSFSTKHPGGIWLRRPSKGTPLRAGWPHQDFFYVLCIWRRTGLFVSNSKALDFFTIPLTISRKRIKHNGLVHLPGIRLIGLYSTTTTKPSTAQTSPLSI